jgi:cytoskeletal protein RodZ
MGTPNAEQIRAEKLIEIGLKLKQVRQANAISLEQVAAKTMINARLLSAIEEGHLDQLPEPVYTQGFIRRFADALGLNGAEVAQTYPTAAIADKPKDQAGQKLKLQTGQLRPVHLYLLYVVVIVLSVSGLSRLVNPPPPNVGSTVPIAPLPKPLAVAQPSPKPQNPVGQVPLPLSSPLKPVQPVKLDVSITQPAWLSVVADGKEVYEGILPSGSRKTWTAQKQIVLGTGNAGGVKVGFNGAAAKPMGQSGAIAEVTFKPTAQPVTAPAP